MVTGLLPFDLDHQDAFTVTIAKAQWNLYTVSNDAGSAIHNPSFAKEVLRKTIEALKAAN